jgi:hypothetical protein
VDRKTAVRKARVEDMIEKAKEKYARAMVEWNVETDTAGQYAAYLENPNTSHANKVTKTKTIYNAIRYGWGVEHCHTPQSSSDHKLKCGIGCSKKVHTGFGLKNKHGHMMQHDKRNHAHPKCLRWRIDRAGTAWYKGHARRRAMR